MVNASTDIRVLVIDDEQVVLDSISEKLQTRVDYRFVVHTYKTTARLINEISFVQPDVILLDNWIGSQDEGVTKALPTIMGTFPDQKVIIITSKRGNDTDQIMEARTWGAYSFIDKQGMWQDDLLIRKIVEACGHQWRSI